jgi:hypothetical protein
MSSVRKAWPARLVAIATTLALVLACTFAAYAHAAAHRHSAGHQAQSAVAHGLHAEKGQGHVHSGHGAGHGHDLGDTETPGSSADSCSILCTGGFAILATAVAIEHPLQAAPAAEPETLLDSAEPSGLERPPKASVPA